MEQKCTLRASDREQPLLLKSSVRVPQLAQFPVGVEMKVPSELLGRRLSGIPAVGGSLRFAQEVDRHRCPEKGIVFGERIGTDPMLLLWTESVHNISQRPFR